MQRLRTVTSLDVSAVAGHHAMPAALLFIFANSPNGVNSQGKSLLPLSLMSRPHFGRAKLSWDTNRKSQKLFSFVKLDPKYIGASQHPKLCAASYLPSSSGSAGSKRSRTVSAEAKYDGQSLQAQIKCVWEPCLRSLFM